MRFARRHALIGRLTRNPTILTIACCVLAMHSMGCRRDGPQKANAAHPSSRTLTVLPAAPKAGQKVLLVHSYHTGYPWVDAITQGVKRALAGSHVDLEIFYMDTKRRTSEEWKQEAGRDGSRVVDEWQPDIVITADDNAQQYFAKAYAGRATPQFVFCGVNASPEKYGFPASNITGVLERPHFTESLRQLHRLVPDAKRIAIVSDDSPTSMGAVESMKQQDAPLELVSCHRPSTFEEWKSAVEQLQDSVDAIAVFNYHTVKRAGESRSMPPKEVMAWTAANSRIPLVGFQTFTVDDGALCGFVHSGVEHGFRAGQIALELLDGKSAADVPIVTALEGQSMLNLTMARKLGIEVLPTVIQDTEIVIGK